MTDARILYSSAAGYAAMMAWYDAALARVPVPYTALTVPTRHGETHLLACGPMDAPPLLLLHGSEGSALSWCAQFEALAATHRVYALDVIGSAGKSAPTRPAYDGPGFAEWLVDVMDALGVARASFAGISMGCWLILKLATYAPERITSAVLMSVNGLVPVRLPYRLARYRVVSVLRATVAPRFTTHRLVRAGIGRMVPPGVTLHPDDAEWFYLLAKHYRFRYPPEPLPEVALRRLTAPVLVLMGTHEPFFRTAEALALAERVFPSCAGAEIIAGAGHGMTADQPAVVNARIVAFLDGVEGVTAPPRSAQSPATVFPAL